MSEYIGELHNYIDRPKLYIDYRVAFYEMVVAILSNIKK